MGLIIVDFDNYKNKGSRSEAHALDPATQEHIKTSVREFRARRNQQLTQSLTPQTKPTIRKCITANKAPEADSKDLRRRLTIKGWFLFIPLLGLESRASTNQRMMKLLEK